VGGGGGGGSVKGEEMLFHIKVTVHTSKYAKQKTKKAKTFHTVLLVLIIHE